MTEISDTTRTPPESTSRCPVCRARFRGAARCPRCAADLGGVMRCMVEAWRWRRRAVNVLEIGDLRAAATAAKASVALHAGPTARRLECLANWLERVDVPPAPAR